MSNRNEEHFCPLCNKVIDNEVCYEICMCMGGGLKLSSIPEVDIEKTDGTKEVCFQCEYNDIM